MTLSYVGRYLCDMWGVVYDRRLSRLMYRRCPCLLLEKLDVLLWLSMNDFYVLYVTHHHCHTIPPLLKMSTPPRLSTSIPYTVLACNSLYLCRYLLLHSPLKSTSIIVLAMLLSILSMYSTATPINNLPLTPQLTLSHTICTSHCHCM